MKVGDLVRAVLADGSGANTGVIVETRPPETQQKTKRITVLLDNGRFLETRASYNLWEVANESR